MVAEPLPPGSEATMGTYMSRGGSPFASSQGWGMTWYWPLPMLCRSELIRSLPGGIWLITFAEGWEAPDLTDRQPPTTSGPEGSWSLSSSLTLVGVPMLVLPLQLPPVVFPDAGRSTVPYAPGWAWSNSAVPT